MKLSAVISAYNAENTIGDCLASLDWVDEVVVVDNSSTDATAAIAKKHGAKMFTRENNVMLNVNKNYGFNQATHEWILNLDADERVTEELKKEIKSRITNYELRITESGFWIPRKNIIFGKWIEHGIWGEDYQLRLFRKGKGRFPEKHVHEYVEVDGKTEKLKSFLMHYNYTTVSQYLQKLDTIYTENEATLLVNKNRKVVWHDAITMPVRDFLKTFFAQEGYKDGLHGLVLSLFQAFYTLIVFAKVWEKQGFTEYNSSYFHQEVTKEFIRLRREVAYWIYSAHIKNETNPLVKIWLRFRRKFVS